MDVHINGGTFKRENGRIVHHLEVKWDGVCWRAAVLAIVDPQRNGFSPSQFLYGVQPRILLPDLAETRTVGIVDLGRCSCSLCWAWKQQERKIDRKSLFLSKTRKKYISVSAKQSQLHVLTVQLR